MRLTAGTRLGPYEVLGAIGAGGIGEVYRARDTRLNRDVAIKVLSAGLASDPDYRQGMSIVRVGLTTAPDFKVGQVHAVMKDGIRVSDDPGPVFTVAPDGRIVTIQSVSEATVAAEYRVILNWIADVKARIDSARR